jgi:uncharacterized membrane protein YvlD (DUF360 family)
MWNLIRSGLFLFMIAAMTIARIAPGNKKETGIVTAIWARARTDWCLQLLQFVPEADSSE